MNKEKQQHISHILSKKTVGIAGAGGLGSNAAISLARSGIGCLIIIDHDIVEESNLNRQYYFHDQIGRHKVNALKENIRRINPQITVTSIQKKLRKGQMHTPFVDVDVIIEALDDAETKKMFIEEITETLPSIPLVAASGVAGYGKSEQITTRNLDHLYVVYDEDAESSDNDVLLAPKVCLMANWQANITLELLLGDTI